MAEKFFWADSIADKIIEEKGDKKEYVCASGITPSGTIHIGNFREVITTELVVRTLRDKGKKVKFIYSWDDYDRFRKVPANIPEDRKGKFENYIGMPVSDVPSPFGKKSYAEYFEEAFEKSLEKVGIYPNFIRQSKMNKSSKYAELIKKAIDNNDKIKKILNKYRKEPLGENWWPIAVYCEKCKKDSTKIISAKGYEIEYECECGFKDKFDIRKKGLVSVKWRVDWPMRWLYEKVDFEPGGIDHSVEGGSYTTAKEIVKEIYNFEPPIYQFYDWVTIKGIELKNFHSSKGNVVTLDEVEEVYEPEIVRYLFVSTRPNKGFSISFDNDVIRVYDEYDKLEDRYYNGTADSKERRIYELSQVKEKPSKNKRQKISFRHLITLVQTGKAKEINKDSEIRAEKVRNWLEKHAGEDMKFAVKENIEVELGEKQKEALIALKESLAVKNFNEDELLNEFYDICNAVGISVKEFFQGAYMVLINKTKGPRLADLISTIGKEKVVGLLEKIK